MEIKPKYKRNLKICSRGTLQYLLILLISFIPASWLLGVSGEALRATVKWYLQSCFLLQRKFLPGECLRGMLFILEPCLTVSQHFFSILLTATNHMSFIPSLPSTHQQPMKGRRGEIVLESEHGLCCSI